MIKYSEKLNDLLAQYRHLVDEADYVDDRNTHNAIEFGLRIPSGETAFSAYGMVQNVSTPCYFVGKNEETVIEELTKLLMID